MNDARETPRELTRFARETECRVAAERQKRKPTDQEFLAISVAEVFDEVITGAGSPDGKPLLAKDTAEAFLARVQDPAVRAKLAEKLVWLVRFDIANESRDEYC